MFVRLLIYSVVLEKNQQNDSQKENLELHPSGKICVFTKTCFMKLIVSEIIVGFF